MTTTTQIACRSSAVDVRDTDSTRNTRNIRNTEEFVAKRLNVRDETVQAWLRDAHRLMARPRPVEGSADQVQLYWELDCPHVNSPATRIPCAMMAECTQCAENPLDEDINKLKLLQDTEVDVACNLDKSIIVHGQPHVLGRDISYVYVPGVCGLYESLSQGHVCWLEQLVQTRGFGEFFVDCVFDDTCQLYTSTQALKVVG